VLYKHEATKVFLVASLYKRGGKGNEEVLAVEKPEGKSGVK
jgi:hypothetical protein